MVADWTGRLRSLGVWERIWDIATVPQAVCGRQEGFSNTLFGGSCRDHLFETPIVRTPKPVKPLKDAAYVLTNLLTMSRCLCCSNGHLGEAHGGEKSTSGSEALFGTGRTCTELRGAG